MKQGTFKSIIKVTTDGELKMYNRDEFLKFIGQFGKGRSFSLEVSVISDRSKDKLRAYYFAEVVPKFQAGWERFGELYNKTEAHEKMKMLYPKMYISEDNYRSIAEESFTNADFCQYIEFLVQYCAEHFEIIINEPNTNYNE